MTIRTIEHNPLRPKRGKPGAVSRYTSTFFMKLEPALKAAFNETCWRNDEFAAEVVRKMMQAYVENSK